MPSPLLRVTDGDTYVDLISRDRYGILLNDWSPAIARPKGGGTYQSSALSSGRRLVSRQLDNVTESFGLKVGGVSQDNAILQLRQLITLLEKATNYWTAQWHRQPVWIEARSAHETNTRYAIIHNYAFDSFDNPFAQPFFNCDASTIDELTVAIERGNWLANQPGVGSQATISWSAGAHIVQCNRVNVGDGDGYAFGDTGFNSAGTTVRFGRSGFSPYNAYFGFDPVNVPQGAVILSAHIVVDHDGPAVPETPTFLIYAEDADDTFDIASRAQFDARVLTTAYREFIWPFTGLASSDQLYLPDMSNVVQEVVDRPGWSSGNMMIFFIRVGSVQPNVYVDVASYNHATLPSPELRITYLDTPETEIHNRSSDSERAYIINGWRAAKTFTHIYKYDNIGPVWSSNLAGSSLPYNLITGGASNRVYLGIQRGAGTGSEALDVPFNNAIFDLANTNEPWGMDWEYYAFTSGWRDIDLTDWCTDNTHEFSLDGINSLHIVPEIGSERWVTANLNTLFGGSAPNVEAYWLRGTYTSGGSATVQAQNNDPYVAQTASIEIDTTSIDGDLPALGHLRVFGSGAESPDESPYTYTTRIVTALRSVGTSRVDEDSTYSDFEAFVPMTSQYAPRMLDSWHFLQSNVDFVTLAAYPTHTALRYNASGVLAMTDLFEFILSEALMGKFRVFVRTRQDGGATSDFNFQLKFESGGETQISDTFSPTILSSATESKFELHEIGLFTLPFTSTTISDDNEIPQTRVTIGAESTAASPGDLIFLDVIFMPADEWIGEFYAPDETVDSGALWGDDRALDIDSVSSPKSQVVSNVKFIRSGFETVQSSFVPLVSSELLLPANTRSKLWVLGAYYDGTRWLSYPDAGYSIQLFTNQQYLAMRGDD